MIPDNLKTNACRWLSKSGGLSAVRDRLEASAQSMTKAQVRDFYCFLRDNAMRWESEWRREFLAIFGVTEADLPTIDDADRWGAILQHLVTEADLEKVRAFVEGIGVVDWNFTPQENEPTIDVYPLDHVDESGDTPSAKARRLGHAEIAQFLEYVKHSVCERYQERWRRMYGRRNDGN